MIAGVFARTNKGIRYVCRHKNDLKWTCGKCMHGVTIIYWHKTTYFTSPKRCRVCRSKFDVAAALNAGAEKK